MPSEAETKLAAVEELVREYWRARAEIALQPNKRYSTRQRQRDRQGIQNTIFKEISTTLGISWEPFPTKIQE